LVCRNPLRMAHRISSSLSEQKPLWFTMHLIRCFLENIAASCPQWPSKIQNNAHLKSSPVSYHMEFMSSMYFLPSWLQCVVTSRFTLMPGVIIQC
jgi:hypothetical protein